MISLEQGIALAALVLFAVIGVLLWLFSLRLRRDMRRQMKNQAALQADLRALCNAAVQMGERINHMDVRIKALHQRQREMGVLQDKMVQSEPQDVSFDQAIKLARKGSSAEELMEICNLSRGEADLITMMHRLDPGS